MCGIIGFVGQVPEGVWGQTYDLLRVLFVASEHRGKDATGFVALAEPLDRPYEGQVVMSKQPIAASQFIVKAPAFRRLAHRRCCSFIGHVRAATHGDPKAPANRNNHPFVSEGGTLFLVHNGIVSDHREVADRYALHLTSDCDSEVLLRLVESFADPGRGLVECLREVRGPMAVALYDRANDRVWLARNGGRPLWLAKLQRDRRWFFASTGTILLQAFHSVLGKHKVQFDYLAPIPEDTPLTLSPMGVVLAPLTGST